MARRTATDIDDDLRSTARQLRRLSSSTPDQWLAAALDINAFHITEDDAPVNVTARKQARERINDLTP